MGTERPLATALYPGPTVPPAHVLDRLPWMRRHPVPVDANTLIEDVLRRTRTDFTALTFVGEQKLAALIAPTHIDAKVREHLLAVAARTGCSVELAMNVYDTSSLLEPPLASPPAPRYTCARRFVRLRPTPGREWDPSWSARWTPQHAGSS